MLSREVQTEQHQQRLLCLTQVETFGARRRAAVREAVFTVAAAPCLKSNHSITLYRSINRIQFLVKGGAMSSRKGEVSVRRWQC